MSELDTGARKETYSCARSEFSARADGRCKIRRVRSRNGKLGKEQKQGYEDRTKVGSTDSTQQGKKGNETEL